MINELSIGDVIQLSFDGTKYTHSLIVIQKGVNLNSTLVAAHTYDTFGKSISSYSYKEYRCIHIENV